VEIAAVAREAGSRSKVAVFSRDSDVDPLGACVGQRGARIQSVMDELGGEKIDIIPFSEEPAIFISNALSPAKVERVDTEIITNPDGSRELNARVVVPDHQYSLAIGRAGQNVRLAARLTGWKIDIKSSTQYNQMAREDIMAQFTVADEDEVTETEEETTIEE
ncbi:MAG TPA: transcription termination/antitermination protein NusA, partial [Bacillota bacterium]|nr:transcription termination/antitermination protein NusA [Bacillota bacterium]